MEWMIMPLKRYADFSGRSQRQEYWMFVLFNILFWAVFITAGVAAVAATSGFGQTGSDAPPVLLWVFLGVGLLIALATFIPTLAVIVRRLHDQNLSGWLYCVSFLPFGSIVILVFMCIDGTPGPNRFGPDPKGRGDPDADIDYFSSGDRQDRSTARPATLS
jgi:uncharacterized membrane protein YhaH (DUF805 family)